jgi:hypothetical protein
MRERPLSLLESRARGHRRPLVRLCALWISVAFTASCRSGEPREPDLPKQPDLWVNSVVLDADSTAKYVGSTKDFLITDITTVKNMDAVKTVKLGDEISGIRIGAIRCSFHWRDASYGGDQYMWRGRWACMAGRSKNEIEAAVAEDGTKRYDYIHLAPVRLPNS